MNRRHIQAVARDLLLFRKAGFSQLILSGGMPRSGSTLLFNILREMLAAQGLRVSSGWIGDIRRMPTGRVYLVKVHEPDILLRLRAHHYFYTFRDVRTVLVSAFRIFNTQATINNVDRFIKQYLLAKDHASLMVKYEMLIESPGAVISEMANVIGIEANPPDILKKVETISPPPGNSEFSASTLLHPNHITGTKPEDWRHVLDSKLLSEIDLKYGWWLRECGYPLS